MNEKLEAGAAWVRIVAEIAPESRSDAEIPAWTRYESFVNLAFASSPTTFICAYDDRSWHADVIADARRSHPSEAHGSEATANSAYRRPEDLLIHLDDR